MGKATKSKAATRPTSSKVDGPSANLEKLSQQQAAWLIGKPASWLRDNSHLDGRNGDGTYNARLLVRAVRAEYQAAELADGDLEPVQQLAEDFASNGESIRPAMIRILDGISRCYGAAGMAAVTETFLAELRLQHNRWGESPHRQRPTADEINDEAQAKIAALPEWGAQHELRIVVLCGSCGRYRWGRQWKEPPWPDGYIGIEGLACPKCE